MSRMVSLLGAMAVLFFLGWTLVPETAGERTAARADLVVAGRDAALPPEPDALVPATVVPFVEDRDPVVGGEEDDDPIVPFTLRVVVNCPAPVGLYGVITVWTERPTWLERSRYAPAPGLVAEDTFSGLAEPWAGDGGPPGRVCTVDFLDLPRDRPLWIAAVDGEDDAPRAGWEPVILPIPPVRSRWTMDVTVAPRAWVRGRFVDRDGRPVSELRLETPDEGWIVREGAERGVFFVGPIRRDRFLMRLRRVERGRAFVSRRELAVRGYGRRDLGDLCVDPLPDLDVQCVDRGGTPVPARVVVEKASGQKVVGLETTDDGRFSFAGRDPRDFRVRVRPLDALRYVETVAEVGTQRSHRIVVDDRAPRCTSLSFWPWAPEARLVFGQLQCTAVQAGVAFHGFGSSTTGCTGSGASIHGVPVGASTLWFWHPARGLCAERRVSIDRDARHHQLGRVQLVDPGTRVHGTFRWPKDAPVTKRLAVRVVPAGTSERFAADLGPVRLSPWIGPGPFTLRGLPAGRPLVLVFAHAGEEVWRSPTLRLHPARPHALGAFPR